MKPEQKLAAARHIVRKRAPYFQSALLGLIPRKAPGLGTIGVTDSMILLWDPDAVAAWSIEALAGGLVHEVCHVLRRHGERCKTHGYDKRLWNYAGDRAINDDLVRTGWKLPNDCLLPNQIGMADGLTEEAYYHAERQKNEESGEDDDRPRVGNGWCGSGAGREVPGEPADGRSKADIGRIRSTVAAAISSSKSRGNVPAGLLRWAQEELAPPKVRWQDKLARACRAAVAYKAGAVDYRYERPSRRQAGVGFGKGKPILPALRAPIPEVAVAVDTSGSMGQKELALAIAETAGILRAAGTPVTFLAGDAAVHAVAKIGDWRRLKDLMKGGGGTDFAPIVEGIAKLRPRPSVAVIITDGYGPAPEKPPAGTNVIWLLVGQGCKKPSTWGEEIICA